MERKRKCDFFPSDELLLIGKDSPFEPAGLLWRNSSLIYRLHVNLWTWPAQVHSRYFRHVFWTSDGEASVFKMPIGWKPSLTINFIELNTVESCKNWWNFVRICFYLKYKAYRIWSICWHSMLCNSSVFFSPPTFLSSIWQWLISLFALLLSQCL